MADNLKYTEGSGGDPEVATNDKGGRHVQVMQLDIGDDSTVSPVASGNPLPVTGTVAVTGVATLAEQQTQTAHLAAIETAVEGTLAVTGPLTDSELRATAVDVNITGGSSSGTEYTEDDAVPSLPSGGALILRRDDDRNLVTVSANGDAVMASGTGKGELRVFDNESYTELLNIKIAAEDLASSNLNPVAEGAEIETLFAVPLGARARTSLSAESGVANGDAVLLNATTKGELYVKQTDAVPVTDNSGSLTVDNGGTFAVQVSSALPAGTNNIGDVDVLTQPARAATTDTITSKIATDAIMNGTTALTPKFAVIDAASSGDNTLVAAVNPKKIRVLAAFLVSAGTVTARFESGASGTALTGQMSLVANSGFTLPFNPTGWFETASNTLLNLELSGNVSVDGCLTYVEV